MANDPTTTRTGPWRIAVLDRSDDDPKWLLATIAPGDVRPAPHIGTDLDELTAWAAARAGLHAPALTRLRHAEVYRIDEQER